MDDATELPDNTRELMRLALGRAFMSLDALLPEGEARKAAKKVLLAFVDSIPKEEQDDNLAVTFGTRRDTTSLTPHAPTGDDEGHYGNGRDGRRRERPLGGRHRALD